MKHIHGDDIGRTLPFAFGQEPFEAQHAWPDETIVSAGGSQHRGSYFLEVYPPEGSFLRGNGATPAEAESAAWAKYQRLLECPTGVGHQWVPGKYRNGSGNCSGCGTWNSGLFTAEELGLHCHACGAAEFNIEVYKVPGHEGDVMLCAEHRLQEAGTESQLSVQRMGLRAVAAASGADYPLRLALNAMLCQFVDDWDWLTDDTDEDAGSSAPTAAARATVRKVLDQLDPGMVWTVDDGHWRAAPLRDGGIRMRDENTGQRIDIDPHGGTTELLYDVASKTWTRNPWPLIEQVDQ